MGYGKITFLYGMEGVYQADYLTSVIGQFLIYLRFHLKNRAELLGKPKI